MYKLIGLLGNYEARTAFIHKLLNVYANNNIKILTYSILQPLFDIVEQAGMSPPPLKLRCAANMAMSTLELCCPNVAINILADKLTVDVLKYDAPTIALINDITNQKDIDWIRQYDHLIVGCTFNIAPTPSEWPSNLMPDVIIQIKKLENYLQLLMPKERNDAQSNS